MRQGFMLACITPHRNTAPCPPYLPRPCSDLEIIHQELRAKDIEWCTKALEAFKKMKQTLTKEQKEEQASAEKALAWLQVRT